ncbi:MAG: class II aldolase/adducin family protein [Candidatus Caenarcaniphilales bacterium]|nr:class II aldolase/adducin family protein [Candidatus Caenarcaniphilales bacterium]
MLKNEDILNRVSVGENLDNSAIKRPEFSSYEEERLYIKQRLAASFRLFAHYGFDAGVAGHISVRDPEHRDSFWVNPMSVHFSKIKVSDLVRVNHGGDIVEGNKVINKAAFAIHSRIHALRPDINAAAHAHSEYGRAWSSLARPLDPISQDACTFYENQVIYKKYLGIVEDCSEGDEIAGLLGDNETVILQNHGLLTTGKFVEAATWLFILMESCCKSQLAIEAVAKPELIPHESALNAKNYIVNDVVHFANFQPLYHMILEQWPDLFE